MASLFRSAVLMTAIACSMSCTAQAPAPAAAKPGDKPALSPTAAAMSAKQRNSYMIGMDVAKSLEPIKDEIDLASLNQAIQTVFDGKPTKLSATEAEQIRNEFSTMLQGKMAAKAAEQAKKNEAEGAAFLASNKDKAGVRS